MRITTCFTSEIVPVAALWAAAAVRAPAPTAMPAATEAPSPTKPLRLIGVIRPVLVTGVPLRHTARKGARGVRQGPYLGGEVVVNKSQNRPSAGRIAGRGGRGRGQTLPNRALRPRSTAAPTSSFPAATTAYVRSRKRRRAGVSNWSRA